MNAFNGLLREAMIVTATIALPVLAIAALAGLAVAVVQAATQVQEQTLSLVPKLLCTGIALACFGNAAMHLLAGLFTDAVRAIPQVVAG